MHAIADSRAAPIYRRRMIKFLGGMLFAVVVVVVVVSASDKSRNENEAAAPINADVERGMWARATSRNNGAIVLDAEGTTLIVQIRGEPCTPLRLQQVRSALEPNYSKMGFTNIVCGE